MTLLNVRNLKGGYTKLPVLKGVSLEVNSNEIVALIGLNGAGKSTIMKHIISLMQPHAGSISINDIEFKGNLAAYRKQFAYIPEVPILYDELTLEEHLKLVAMTYGVSESDYKVRVEKLLKEFRMEKRLKWYPSNFSKGMKQKVMIMCAFLVQPNLYVIDEPFVGLDPIAINSLLDTMIGMKKSGAGILMSTHILATAEKYCDRFIIMHEGEIIASGTHKELQDKYNLPNATLDEIYISLTVGDDDGN